MKRLAHAKRRDANESDIVKRLRQIGCSVMRLDEFDLLLGYHGHDFKVEVKTKTGKTTQSQNDMLANWRGSPLHIARSFDECLAIITNPLRR